MALNDLNLEFEDEEETKKNKNNSLDQDVVLEFGTPVTNTNLGPGKEAAGRPVLAQAPQAAGRSGAIPVAARPAGGPAQVKKIDDARAAVATAQAGKRPQATISQVTNTSGSSALKAAYEPAAEGNYEDQSQEIIELRERARVAEFNAEVKVQVAEFKTEILSELLGDMKLMDHQINQLLMRIHAKHPEMKQEVLLIKKILADFNAKKRR